MCPTDKECGFVEADPFRGGEQYSELSWQIITGQEIANAHSLGYRGPVVLLCLLHDLVEDSSRRLEDVGVGLAEMDRFGARTTRGVRLLTNRYAILLHQVAPRIQALPFEPGSLQRVAREVARERSQSDAAVRDAFQHEFARLLDWLAWDVDLTAGAARARRDHRYDLAEDLRLRSYVLYVLDAAWTAPLFIWCTTT